MSEAEVLDHENNLNAMQRAGNILRGSEIMAVILSGALFVAPVSLGSESDQESKHAEQTFIELEDWEIREAYNGESCDGNPMTFNIQGEDGSPVVAQVGFDYKNQEGVSVMPNGEPKGGKPYGQVVLVNVPGILEEPVTEACGDEILDDSIVSTSIEIYSAKRFNERMLETSDRYLNNSDQYLDSMVHNVQITGEVGQIPDLLLPARCGYVEDESATSGSINAIVYQQGNPERIEPYRHIAWSRAGDDIRGFAAVNILQKNAPDSANVVYVEDNNRYMSKVHVVLDDYGEDKEVTVQIEDVNVDTCAQTKLLIDLGALSSNSCVATVVRENGDITQPECQQSIKPADGLMR